MGENIDDKVGFLRRHANEIVIVGSIATLIGVLGFSSHYENKKKQETRATYRASASPTISDEVDTLVTFLYNFLDGSHSMTAFLDERDLALAKEDPSHVPINGYYQVDVDGTLLSLRYVPPVCSEDTSFFVSDLYGDGVALRRDLSRNLLFNDASTVNREYEKHIKDLNALLLERYGQEVMEPRSRFIRPYLR
jgi:hypothetical protein